MALLRPELPALPPPLSGEVGGEAYGRDEEDPPSRYVPDELTVAPVLLGGGAAVDVEVFWLG